jgi:hypothetical protein
LQQFQHTLQQQKIEGRNKEDSKKIKQGDSNRKSRGKNQEGRSICSLKEIPTENHRGSVPTHSTTTKDRGPQQGRLQQKKSRDKEIPTENHRSKETPTENQEGRSKERICSL